MCQEKIPDSYKCEPGLNDTSRISLENDTSRKRYKQNLEVSTGVEVQVVYHMVPCSIPTLVTFSRTHIYN